MGHYINCNETKIIKFRPDYPTTDFESWWRKQTACERDGCRSVTVKVDSRDNLTKVREARFWKKTKKKLYEDFLEYPGQYECHAVLIGIVGWCCERVVRRIVNHHVKEVIERKTYKTRPTKGLKGATTYAIGKFVMSYDARDYDPLKH